MCTKALSPFFFPSSFVEENQPRSSRSSLWFTIRMVTEKLKRDLILEARSVWGLLLAEVF